MYYNSAFYGMHFAWWVFWGFLWVSLFAFWTPVPRRRMQDLKEEPIAILKRRLAKGEIGEQEYLKLKSHLESNNEPKSAIRAV